MLYLTFTIDRQAVGFAEREAESTAQAKRVAEVHRYREIRESKNHPEAHFVNIYSFMN